MTTEQRNHERVGLGWRIFQLVGLVAGLSYLVGWLSGNPLRYIEGMDSPLSAWTGTIALLSPLVAIALIVLAIDPQALAFLRKRTATARILQALFLILTVGWMVNALLWTPMYTKFLTTPLEPAQVLPIPGGVFVHMVLQHWFQSIAVLVLALAPQRFTALTDSPQARVQCAVVKC